MKIIVVASQKGGAGKTTIARHLAVAAPGRVAIIDADPQATLSEWWQARAADAPALARVGPDPGQTLDELRRAGVDLVVIDTPPSQHASITDWIARADLVVIPVRPTPDDLRAIGATIDAVEAAGRPFVFVLSQAKARTRLALESVPALAAHGRVCPTPIHDRVEYPISSGTGKTVTETDPKGAAAAEIAAVTEYVLTQVRKQVKGKKS